MRKVAFFDFNGTLTQNNNSFDFLVGNKKFGFKRFVYRFFGFLPFVRKLGLKHIGSKLKNKKITEDFVKTNSLKIELRKDITHVFNTLNNLGYKIVIISGGFTEVIETALNKNVFLVDKIFSNNLIFENNLIKNIKVNPCDFGGKKKIILQYLTKNEISIENAIFICNSFNDKSALNLPLKKFCFNNNTKQKNVIKISSLSEILKLIN